MPRSRSKRSRSTYEESSARLCREKFAKEERNSYGRDAKREKGREKDAKKVSNIRGEEGEGERDRDELSA